MNVRKYVHMYTHTYVLRSCLQLPSLLYACLQVVKSFVAPGVWQEPSAEELFLQRLVEPGVDRDILYPW